MIEKFQEKEIKVHVARLQELISHTLSIYVICNTIMHLNCLCILFFIVSLTFCCNLTYCSVTLYVAIILAVKLDFVIVG